MFLYLWGLPQNLLGLFLMTIYKKKKMVERIIESKRYNTVKIIILKKAVNFGGISLGKYIIISDSYVDKTTIIKHEEGHYIQSMIFGPLYLILIGIPSLSMNLLSSYNNKFGNGKYSENYYKRWPENWADKLGNVKRYR